MKASSDSCRNTAQIEVDPAAYLLANALAERRLRRGQGYRGRIKGTPLSQKWLSAKNAVRRDMIYEMITTGRPGGGCAAGSVGGVVNSDGSVRICEMIDEEVGNLHDHDYDLAAIWAGSPGACAATSRSRVASARRNVS